VPADSHSLGRRGHDPALGTRQIREHSAYKVSDAYRVRLGQPGDVAGQTLDHAGTDANRVQ
jgi:hypothetical protein